MRGVGLAILGVGLMHLLQGAVFVPASTRLFLTWIAWGLMLLSLVCIVFGV